MNCKFCGFVDEIYNENAKSEHRATTKHLNNLALANYKLNKKKYASNRDGINVYATVHSEPNHDENFIHIEDIQSRTITVNVNPYQKVEFIYDIENTTELDNVQIVGVLLPHPQPQFRLTNSFLHDEECFILNGKTSVRGKVAVTFESEDIGHYEMPIFFTFQKDKKDVIIVREMVIEVLENLLDDIIVRVPEKSHYTNQKWETPDHYIRSPFQMANESFFKIPKHLKIVLPHGLGNDVLKKIKMAPAAIERIRECLEITRKIFNEGITEKNYMLYFHHLLWWEEVIAINNMKNYNMSGVKLVRSLDSDGFLFEAKGLAEKRPHVLRDDKILIRPTENHKIMYEGFVKTVMESKVQVTSLDERFNENYNDEDLFDIHFTKSRVPFERMHTAVSKVQTSGHIRRLFPTPSEKPPKPLKMINQYYNNLIRNNAEQRSAVQHIVSGTSRRSPYILFGPPGTGKTMTVVEAIIQLAVDKPHNKILVCADSNSSADNIAVMLLQYSKDLNIKNFMFRLSARTRDWSTLPSVLANVSNGTSYENSYVVSNAAAASYRVLVMTLSHAAKYAMPRNQALHKLQMTHLFIDEAGQASEPATLVPICGLLAPSGHLVLAGDPKQLGPVCVSQEARRRGLGMSLMERLIQTYDHLYENDPKYIIMLVKNFRSDPDILQIPNSLFYDDCLQPLARPDPLSNVSLLGLPGGERAIVFHAVQSQELRIGKTPSFYNEMEVNMLKRYIQALVEIHNVAQDDIGIIAPYIRQVHKIKNWLDEKYSNIEVGTVEAFQGKEKRVILVSTVRANSKLLDYDARYGLGFLVDEKRFNVTLTRAKAKIIIIGNPACLMRDLKWRMYMQLCTDYETYHGKSTQQLARDTQLHSEINRRLKKTRITEDLKQGRIQLWRQGGSHSRGQVKNI